MTAKAADPLDMDRLRTSAPGETALLKKAQVAAWLQIGVGQVDRYNLPTIRLGGHTTRYSVRQVLAHLERLADDESPE